MICKFIVFNISPQLRGRDLTDFRSMGPLCLCSGSRLAADIAPRLPLVVSSATPGPGDAPRPFSATICPDLLVYTSILISPDCKIRPKGQSYSQSKLVTAPPPVIVDQESSTPFPTIHSSPLLRLRVQPTTAKGNPLLATPAG